MVDLLRALVEYCAESFSKLLYFGSDDSSEKPWTWKEMFSTLFVVALVATAVIYLVIF